MTAVIAVFLVVPILAVGCFEVLMDGPHAKEFAGPMILALGAGYGYWLSSSSGSKQKSDATTATAIALAEKANPTEPPK